MPVVGLHCSHEQIPPSRLLGHAKHAEAAGFGAIMSSDHFSPWSERQGESGFAWSWLGAAMDATELPFGVVNAPGQRYHPAIIAQAAATLGEMFPGRLWVALGTGEASNEHITGDPWPDKATRNARLRECVDIIRALFAGETVSHDGLVQVDRAKLHTLPRLPPPLIGPAISVDTASWVGEWADGLATVNQPPAKLEEMIAAFRSNGGQGKRLVLQVHLSWAPSEEEALQRGPRPVALERLPATHVLGSRDGRGLRPPRPRRHHPTRSARSSSSQPISLGTPPGSRSWRRSGFDEINLHHVGEDLTAFIEAFGEHVVPELST